MLAHFHSSGNFPVSSEVLMIFARGVDIMFFISDNICGIHDKERIRRCKVLLPKNCQK